MALDAQRMPQSSTSIHTVAGAHEAGAYLQDASDMVQVQRARVHGSPMAWRLCSVLTAARQTTER
jgi:hypothetical protein